jgi:hypothetical protein
MAAFRDATGRPGPATWELGRFPDGQSSHCVVGVSWYEAAAYGGRHDHFFPEGPTQRPFRQLLGTAAKDRRFVLYDAGHALPRKDVARESIDWLDRYLGPVRRQ